jgi:hypothetical protein
MVKLARRSLYLLFLIPCLYAGSYVLLVDARLDFTSGVGPWEREPHYLLGGDAVKPFFAPIHMLDRWVRPNYWQDL